jgi:hypothetical protein
MLQRWEREFAYDTLKQQFFVEGDESIQPKMCGILYEGEFSYDFTKSIKGISISCIFQHPIPV